MEELVKNVQADMRERYARKEELLMLKQRMDEESVS